MILDSLAHLRDYAGVHPHVPQVAAFLEAVDLGTLAVGRHEVGTEGCFALVSEYETIRPEEGFIECHRRYIDIQILLSGLERIGVCRAADCTAAAYDEEQDLQKLAGEVSFVTLRPGSFALFFPRDGHMPRLRPRDEATRVRKIVVKVPVIPAVGVADGSSGVSSGRQPAAGLLQRGETR